MPYLKIIFFDFITKPLTKVNKIKSFFFITKKYIYKDNVINYFERKSKAFIIPPGLKGIPDCFKPISTPARVPASIRSLNLQGDQF